MLLSFITFMVVKGLPLLPLSYTDFNILVDYKPHLYVQVYMFGKYLN